MVEAVRLVQLWPDQFLGQGPVVYNNKQLSSWLVGAPVLYELSKIAQQCTSIAATVKTMQRWAEQHDFHSDSSAHALWNSWPDHLPIASTGPVAMRPQIKSLTIVLLEGC